MIEPMLLPDKEQVDKYLPPNDYPLPLWPDKPVAMGDFAPPIIFSEAKKAQEMHLRSTKTPILQHWEEFGKQFGRYYHPIECYNCENAKTFLFTMGSFTETAMTAVDELKTKGQNIGLVRIRLWRPFPFAELREALKDAETLIVLDRSLSYGYGGPVCSELRSVLYGQPKQPKVASLIGGLGGRDITPQGFIDIINRGIEITRKGSAEEFEFYGVRG
jgi:pyruvate ferredoxin oxidoreductase alpha subunit